MLGLTLSLGAGVPSQVSLASRALSAIRRNGGTLLLPGASTPVLGPELIPSMDLSTWTSGGVFGNWGSSTATSDTLTSTSSGGSRHVRLPCTPGTEYWFSGRVVGGTSSGLVTVAFGTSAATYITLTQSPSLPAGVVSVMAIAPANAAFVEFVIRGGTVGQTTTFADFRAGVLSGYTHGNPPLRNYLDSAGTDLLDSVTQVDQPVGLVLDSLGVLGPELVTSQDLSTWTSGGAFGNWGTSTATNDTITTTATNGARYRRFAVAPGTTIAASAVVNKVGTATGVRISVVFGTSAGVYISETPISTPSATPTFLTVIGSAPSNAAFCEIVIRADGVAGSQGTFTSISVREIPGNHATQATTASKPLLRRDANGNYAWQFDGSNDFLQTGITTGNEGWVCAGVTDFTNATTQTLVVNGAGDATAKGVWIAKAAGTNAWTFNLSDGLGGVRQSLNTPGVAVNTPAVQDFGWNGTTAIAATNGTETSVAQIKNVVHTTPLSICGGVYSFWFNGSMSATVYTPVLPSPADRALIRRFVGSLQGQQL